jgi:exopolysaccharide biosynthesis polyprenyl glycosylphosphotransferase
MLRFRTLVLLLGDFSLLLSAYLLAAYFLSFFGLPPGFDLEIFLLADDGWQRFLFLIVSLVIGIYFIGLYESIRVASRSRLIEDLLIVWGAAFLLQAMVSYTRTNLMLSRWIMITGSPMAISALVLWRIGYSQLILKVVGRERVLFLGDSPVARRLAPFIQEHPERGYAVIGCADYGGGDFEGQPYIPIDEKLKERILAENIQLIAISASLRMDEPLNRQLRTLSMEGMPITSVAHLYETIFLRIALETVTIDQYVFSLTIRPRRWALAFQTFYGFTISLAGVLLTWPLMVLTAIAVKLDSPGPALLRQKRIGWRGKPFEILKFRSMYVDADKATGPLTRADKGDARITRVGRFIRQSRLDELPQFFNVLRGEMALVGPRPEMPAWGAELEGVLPLYPQRYRVKPGITGWAQLHHSPELTIADTANKLEYDFYYIKNLSPALDLMIILFTIKTVILRVGAR